MSRNPAWPPPPAWNDHNAPELTPCQAEYLEWLTDPDRKGSQMQWAKDHHVAVQTVIGWKRENHRFKRALQRRLDELNLRPDRVQEVLDNMHRLAKSSGREAVAAAKTYLQYVDRLDPSRKAVEDKKISELSQDELLEQLEAAADDQRRRQVKAVPADTKDWNEHAG